MRLLTTTTLALLLATAAVLAQSPGAPKDTLHPVELLPVSDTVKIPVLDFKNTDIRDVLRAMGIQYKVNLDLQPEVQGKINLYLTEVPLRNAIDFIIKRNNFSYSVDNNIVRVFKAEAPPAPPPPKPPMNFKLRNGLVDLDIKDVPVRDAARLFIDSANINVVVESQAEKKVTGVLKQMAPEKAIRVLFESNGLSVTTSDNVFYVGDKTWGGDQGTTQGAKKMERLSISVTPDTLVTIEVDGAQLDQVVRTVAIQCGINVMIYDNLTGAITCKVRNLRVENALRYLLQNTKFTFWKDNGIYFIGSREMSQQKTTVVVPLKHIMANDDDLLKMLPPYITKNADIKVDKEHNSVFVIGSFDIIAQAQEYLDKMDKPIPQVLIEALVVDFNLNRIREFGVSIFTGGSDSAANWLSEEFVPRVNLKPGQAKTQRVLQHVLNLLGVNRLVQLPATFRSSIQALETADVIKVHSTPQIATINGNPASITIGESRYYKLSKETRTANDNSNSNIVGTDERFEKIDLNTRLEVTPWVMDDGYVIVKIKPEFKIPRTGGDLDRPPTTDTRVLESMVRLKDGQTIVLGGQRQTSDVVNNKGVPFLSSIPVLGLLFSHKSVSKSETQMMIFLTPHIYYGNEASVIPDDYFGSDVKKIFEKNDPDRLKKQREERKKAREEARARKDRKFMWPWQRIRERREAKGE